MENNEKSMQMIEGLRSSVSYENEESYIYADIQLNKK